MASGDVAPCKRAASPVATRPTGKRTYAEAALQPAPPRDDALPAALERGLRRRRRLSAPRRHSLARRLLLREQGLRPRSVDARDAEFARDKFANMRLQKSFDSHDDGAMAQSLMMYKRRSKVIEIVSSKDLVFSLTSSGVCAAFSRDLGRRVCFMNVAPDEVIRSLFLNKTNDSLITVSVYRKDEYSSLHCRSTPIAHIRKGFLKSGFPIFESESLRWPGFVEFDDVNGKILTFSAENKKYKVWDLKTYKHLYTVKYDGIHEIKISPGIMLLIFHRQDSHVPIRVINVETGELLKEIKHMMQRKRKVDFIEQFHDKLLVKREMENLQIIDVCTGDLVDVEKSQFLTPNAFIFLYESEMFLTFQQRNVSVWNFRGEKVTVFEDHVLYHSDSNTSSMYITQRQDIIVSYCQQESECGHGSINLSWIDTGKSIAKICCRGDDPKEHVQALESVTALYFNEERNEIYSGTTDGKVHVWSN